MVNIWLPCYIEIAWSLPPLRNWRASTALVQLYFLTIFGLRKQTTEEVCVLERIIILPPILQLTMLGIQCHTAPYSWKIVFECDHQLFEIIFSACSSKEELVWRNRLNFCTSREHTDSYDQAFMTTVSLSMKSLGTVFGKPG